IPYFRPYRAGLAFGLFLVIASSGLTSVVPWLLRAALDAMERGAPMTRIWTLVGYMLALALIGGIARYGMREMLNGISRRIEYDLRNDLFAHLELLDAGYFARTRTGEIMARLTNDLSAVRMAAGPAIMYLVNTIFGGAFALAFMLRIDHRLTALALLPMLLLPVLTLKLGTKIHDRFEDVQQHFGKVTTLTQENLSGVRVVRAYRQEAAEIDRFRRMNDIYLDKNMRLARLYGIMNPAFGLLAGLGTLTVLGIGGVLAVRGTISIGSFVGFGLYLSMLTWPLIALGWVTNLFQRGGASMARLNEILDTPSSVMTPEHPRRLPAASAGRSIEFRDVGFHYPTREGNETRWVLRDVSFTIPAGATVGIVGATGSGKSALMDLIPRFHDPQEGEILIDGVPVRDAPLRELRAEIGYVPQESLLFSDTIGSNVGYGIASHPLPAGLTAPRSGDDAPEDAKWAASIAQLDETIADFPDGWETMLGERGINLSGGQKQRAALARALARHPRIVLLDDALSAVDSHTEAAILHSLQDALAGRTAVIASHRISAIRDATWIIVLEDGRVVEQGRHNELMAAHGRYWRLLRRQQLVESIEQEGEALAGALDTDTIVS
ncbi:MAG TPA: ABC transporter ATP-binding protein, partial [Gemmatimonadaceae bacterium]|nr:ABC transporter ATP-binding protein [Gemmatimonadaceae bacterium]